MPELIAVLLGGHGFEKTAAHELLGDGRSALREDVGGIGRVPASHLRKAPDQVSELELAEHAGKSGVVNSAV